MLASCWDSKSRAACDWKDHKSLAARVRLLVNAGYLVYTAGGKGRGACSIYQLTVPVHLAPACTTVPSQASLEPPPTVDREIREVALPLRLEFGNADVGRVGRDSPCDVHEAERAHHDGTRIRR